MTQDGPPRYGLDIETDTTDDGLDPGRAAIVAVAVEGNGVEEVFDGPEVALLTGVDDLLARLPPGVLVTWNGAAFDLPFLADRARITGTTLGLEIRPGVGVHHPHDPLAGHSGGYHGHWHAHRHLDGYRLYRADLGRALPISCGLKSLARLVGLDAVEVDSGAIHHLDEALLRSYVTSDARLARQLVDRRWPAAASFVDPW